MPLIELNLFYLFKINYLKLTKMINNYYLFKINYCVFLSCSKILVNKVWLLNILMIKMSGWKWIDMKIQNF